MNYSSTQDLADESGLLLPKANAHPKRRGVAAALVSLCFASGVAYASTRSSRAAMELDIGSDVCSADNCYELAMCYNNIRELENIIR